MSINKVILVGNVGNEPEIREVSNGSSMATFSLATSETWKDKTSGEKKEKTEWHRIVVYSPGLANIVKLYVKKGTKLYLEGSLQTRKWTGEDGTEKYSTEIVLQGFSAILQILDNKINESNKKSDSKEENIDDDIYF